MDNLQDQLKSIARKKTCSSCDYDGAMDKVELRPKSTIVLLIMILVGAFFLQGALSMMNGWGTLGTVGNTLAGVLYAVIGTYLIFPKYVKECPKCHTIRGGNSYLSHLGHSKVETASTTSINEAPQLEPFAEKNHATSVAKEAAKGLGLIAILLGGFFLFMVLILMWWMAHP